jgi:alkanesulfonate monooxygenase SsuD/methylene tetrahydromethanopterin reductase-like flavin-dependent oxidoreductase (luciferase family)
MIDKPVAEGIGEVMAESRKVGDPVLPSPGGGRSRRPARSGRRSTDGHRHTFFTDETLAEAVAAVRRGADQAGRDPASVRVWSVLATVGDHLDEEARLRKLVGRLATCLQGYGDLLVRVNGWDPAALARFRADDPVSGYPGAFNAIGTPDQLRHVAGLLPDEWLAAR